MNELIDGKKDMLVRGRIWLLLYRSSRLSRSQCCVLEGVSKCMPVYSEIYSSPASQQLKGWTGCCRGITDYRCGTNHGIQFSLLSNLSVDAAQAVVTPVIECHSPGALGTHLGRSPDLVQVLSLSSWANVQRKSRLLLRVKTKIVRSLRSFFLFQPIFTLQCLHESFMPYCAYPPIAQLSASIADILLISTILSRVNRQINLTRTL